MNISPILPYRKYGIFLESRKEQSMKWITAFIALSCLLISSALWAGLPQQMTCYKVDSGTNNTQCIYNVSQDPRRPYVISNLFAMANMKYALCSGTQCTINKDNPNMSTCVCPIFGGNTGATAWMNASVGPYKIEDSEPQMENNRLVSVISNFSLANIKDKTKLMATKCVSTTPAAWANCFGVRCQVGADGTTVTCPCPVVRSTEFVSMGPTARGQCTLPDNKIWSAATVQQGLNNLNIMLDMYRSYYPGSPFSS